tara:strand:- start:741 stop:1439 length:699 start_codon:yes stop_codon:yes gene_type:complete
MNFDPYKILGIKQNATFDQIKVAYRNLVKKHHPDAGGDEKLIISINKAWALLKNAETRRNYELEAERKTYLNIEIKDRSKRNAYASEVAKKAQGESIAEEDALINWLKIVYIPINRLLGQIINQFPSKLKELSADPYDDELMGAFCEYLETSQKKIKNVQKIYQSISTPNSIKNFSLSLYHCLAQVQDALNEFEHYTMGYVDDYLHDGREMLKNAKQKRLLLQNERRSLTIS